MANDVSTGPIECPPPGIYRDVPFETYCRWDALNMSTLVNGLVCPEHLKAALAGRMKKDSKAMNFGRAIHARLLEPKVYEDEWTIIGPCEATLIPKKKGDPARGCKNNGKCRDEKGRWYCGTHGGALPEPGNCLTADEAANIELIGDKIQQHEVFQVLQQFGAAETSAVWDCRGHLFKIRIDKLIPKSSSCPFTAIDVKKVRLRFGGNSKFGRSVVDYDYHIRAVCYMRGLKQLTGKTPAWTWIIVEDSYPFSIGTYKLAQCYIDIANYEFDRLMDIYERGQRTGQWDGYTTKIEEVKLPYWYVKPIEDAINGVNL